MAFNQGLFLTSLADKLKADKFPTEARKYALGGTTLYPINPNTRISQVSAFATVELDEEWETEFVETKDSYAHGFYASRINEDTMEIQYSLVRDPENPKEPSILRVIF